MPTSTLNLDSHPTQSTLASKSLSVGELLDLETFRTTPEVGQFLVEMMRLKKHLPNHSQALFVASGDEFRRDEMRREEKRREEKRREEKRREEKR